MTDDLVPWLREQIAVTETWAREALDRPWLAEDNFVLDENGGEVARFEIKADARHAALNEPRAVLAQCEAHTAILGLHPPKPLNEYDREVYRFGVECGGCSWECYGDAEDRVEFPCDNVKAVALAYQHRPGYRDEWRP